MLEKASKREKSSGTALNAPFPLPIMKLIEGVTLAVSLSGLMGCSAPVKAIDPPSVDKILTSDTKYRDLPLIEYPLSIEWFRQRIDKLGEYFISTGISSQLVLPQHIVFQKMTGESPDQEDSATADCYSKTIRLNERFIDPNSNWNQPDQVVGTLRLMAHELYHFQVACGQYNDDNQEASAEIISLYILNTIANDPKAEKKLVIEAQRGIVETLARWADYNNVSYSKQSLYRYRKLPYHLLHKGLHQGYLCEGDILIPANHDYDTLLSRLDPNDVSESLPLPNRSTAKTMKKLDFTSLKRTILSLTKR